MFYTLRNADTPLRYAKNIDDVLQTILPFYAVMLGLLMVSRVPYPHVVNQVFRGQRSLAHVVGVIFAFVAIMVIPGYSVAIIFCVFTLYGPLRMAWAKIMHRRQEEEESLF
jgi:CDP-diacylglycerol---serine O-phosphatidyltransferase